MNRIGKVVEITGNRLHVFVGNLSDIDSVDVEKFTAECVSVGALIGTDLVDGRTLVLNVEEVYVQEPEAVIIASVSGIYDKVAMKFSFGTNSYPLLGEYV